MRSGYSGFTQEISAPLNLQPVYPVLLGALTIVVTGSGLVMLLRPAR